MARVGARSVRKALREHGGNVSAVAEAFDVTRQTVYNWISKYALRDEMEDSRETMFTTAEKNLNLAVQLGDIDASKFVLTHMPVARRWSSRSEITGKDGAPLLLPPDLEEKLAAMGIEKSAVVREFEAMMREIAAGHTVQAAGDE